MPSPVPTSPRAPQRVLVVGTPDPALSGFVERLSVVLDLPVVTAADVHADRDVERLAQFEGWIVLDSPLVRSALLPVADLLVHVRPEAPGTLRGLVRRTVRRMRADAEADVTWLDHLAQAHPDLPVVQLGGAEQVRTWLTALEGTLSD